MSGIIEKLTFYFQYPFVWYALIVGILIALCSSLLGVTFSALSDFLLSVTDFLMWHLVLWPLLQY
mgnify:CR=1 FL=1